MCLWGFVTSMAPHSPLCRAAGTVLLFQCVRDVFTVHSVLWVTHTPVCYCVCVGEGLCLFKRVAPACVTVRKASADCRWCAGSGRSPSPRGCRPRLPRCLRDRHGAHTLVMPKHSLLDSRAHSHIHTHKRRLYYGLLQRVTDCLEMVA